MAAISQEDEEEEECRALERELADEIAALTAQDVDFTENLSDFEDSAKNEENYVRLDLEKVLQHVQMVNFHELLVNQIVRSEEGGKLSNWELLLESVERNEREFFQPFHEDLNEIRLSIRNVKLEKVVENVQKDGESIDFQSKNDFQPLESVEPANSAQNVEKTVLLVDSPLTQLAMDNSLEDSTLLAPFRINSTLFNVLESDSHELQRLPVVLSQEFPEDDQLIQKQLQEIAKQHEVCESRRLKAHAKHQKERAEAANLLQKFQHEFDIQEKKAEIARQEAKEQKFMANEEFCCRFVAAVERETRENTLMTLAEEDSRKFALELTRIQDAINDEIIQMSIEEKIERKRMKFERELRDQKQKTLIRCRFSAILSELVKYHEIQQNFREKEIRRERRECVNMRAEEANSRRVIAEFRALQNQKKRVKNRLLMLQEDEISSCIEILERTRNFKLLEKFREEECQVWMKSEEIRTRLACDFAENLYQRKTEESSRLTMEIEEERCRCVWVKRAQLEAEELKQQCEATISKYLQRIDGNLRRNLLLKHIKRWRQWCNHCNEQDHVRSVDIAAKRIQIWHRSCRQRVQQFPLEEFPLVLEDFSDEVQICANNAANQNAALRLQSTFRGFHVRQKFANALALAQCVKNQEEGDSFVAVDLSDFIEPPELEDGWENPILPSVITEMKYSQSESKCLQISNNEVEDLELITNNCNSTVKISTKVENPPKEHNYAATLWNKMRRSKQRQQHVQQERQRQQDPIYRVQKLLNRRPNSRTGTINQSSILTQQGSQQTVSWSSTSNVKKKPKIKLPSLVERLRRQTMAER